MNKFAQIRKVLVKYIYQMPYHICNNASERVLDTYEYHGLRCRSKDSIDRKTELKKVFKLYRQTSFPVKTIISNLLVMSSVNAELIFDYDLQGNCSKEKERVKMALSDYTDEIEREYKLYGVMRWALKKTIDRHCTRGGGGSGIEYRDANFNAFGQWYGLTKAHRFKEHVIPMLFPEAPIIPCYTGVFAN